MGRLFGTDGIRGEAGLPPMTSGMVHDLARAAAAVCMRGAPAPHVFVIGRDTRASGNMFECALAAGLCSMGAEVRLAGVIPTPAVAFLARQAQACAGAMVSASHNPHRDNGVKFFSSAGYKLPDAAEAEIEDLVLSGRARDLPSAATPGGTSAIDDAAEAYAAFCRRSLPADASLAGLRVVLDCANGAASRVAPALFRRLGVEATALNCEPDGTNINAGCGSQHPEALAARVVEAGADAGLAFDGDADRLVAVDDTGAVLTGDHVVAVCAAMYKVRGWLRNLRVVTTVMSNFGFVAAMERLGIERTACAVGDRHVLEKMREVDAVIGGEPSGHTIFLDHHTTGDGLISALQVLAAMRFSGQPLSHLARVMTLFPQETVNVEVRARPPLEDVPGVAVAVAAAERELAGRGRVLVRYSGTQPLCRVMVEGPAADITARLCGSVADAVRRALG